MKYCPFCGTELLRGTVSYCQECGSALTEQRPEQPGPFVVRDEPEVVEKRRRVEWTVPGRTDGAPRRSSYDGYYDDIVPEDGMVHETPTKNKSMALKIGLIIGGVILTAGICLAVLFFL